MFQNVSVNSEGTIGVDNCVCVMLSQNYLSGRPYRRSCSVFVITGSSASR